MIHLLHLRQPLLYHPPLLPILLQTARQHLHVLHQCLHVRVVAGGGHHGAVDPGRVHCCCVVVVVVIVVIIVVVHAIGAIVLRHGVRSIKSVVVG